MANTVKRGNVGTIPFTDYSSKYGAVNTAQTFYPNSLVGLQQSGPSGASGPSGPGYLDKMDDAYPKQLAGVYAEVNQYVPSGNLNGDIKIDVNQPRFVTVTVVSAITVNNLNQLVYAYDDQTVSLTPGNNGNVVGRIHALAFDGAEGASGTAAIVELFYGSIEERRIWVASASGAIPVKEGTVLVADAAACALTLALPIAGLDDGKQLSVVSTTAYAHTVTTPTNGLNGNKHVATCGGAAGNVLPLVAYQGVWYVLPSSGITLS